MACVRVSQVNNLVTIREEKQFVFVYEQIRLDTLLVYTNN